MGRETGSETGLEIRKILKQRETERVRATDSHSKETQKFRQKKEKHTHTHTQSVKRDRWTEGGRERSTERYERRQQRLSLFGKTIYLKLTGSSRLVIIILLIISEETNMTRTASFSFFRNPL